MGTKLNTSPIIHVLAADLGLGSTKSPVQGILDLCQKKVKRFLHDFKDFEKPTQLLSLVANKVGTLFIDVHSDEDLKCATENYMSRGELLFAKLEDELAGGVYGITLRLTHPAQYDLPYVSIIDCRGSKARKAYFTKWHEIGHLLILTDQRRLEFRRTHSLHEPKHPEEALVDLLAGEFAYYAPMLAPLAKGEISFEAVEEIRDKLCPEGSFTSALIGVSKAWPRPCVLLEAKMAAKKGSTSPNQVGFDFMPPPAQALRAVNVTVNESARKRGIQFLRHFRVPTASIISEVFRTQSDGGEAAENLNWWRASNGAQLANIPVLVRARLLGDSVYALLIPRSRN